MEYKSNGAMRPGAKPPPSVLSMQAVEDPISHGLEQFDLSAFNPVFVSTKAASIQTVDGGKTSPEVKNFLTQSKELADLGNRYDIEVVQRGNDQLYDLLASVYDLALRIEQHPQAKAILDAIRDDFKVATTASIKSDASSLATMVRYVIRTDKSSASRYTQVLEIMKREERAPDEVPRVIRERGGLSAITKRQSEKSAVKLSEKERKERTGLVRDFLKHKGLASTEAFGFEGTVQQFKAQDQSSKESASFTVFITLRDAASGDFKIVQSCDLGKSNEDMLLKMLVQDDSVSNAELELIVRGLKKQMLKLPHVASDVKEAIKQDLSKPPALSDEPPIDVKAIEKPSR
jgi:hypothetical protein